MPLPRLPLHVAFTLLAVSVACSADDLARALDSVGEARPDLYRIDLTSGAMTRQAPPATPFGLARPPLVAAGDRLVYVGGVSKSAEVYDTETAQWAEVPLVDTFEQPLVAVVGADVFLGFGVKDSLPYNNLQVLHLDTNTVESLPSFPSTSETALPRVLIPVAGELYSFVSGSTYAFQTSDRVWSRKGAAPGALCDQDPDAVLAAGDRVIFAQCRKDSAEVTQPIHAVVWNPSTDSSTEHEGPTITPAADGFFGRVYGTPEGFLYHDAELRWHRFNAASGAWTEVNAPPTSTPGVEAGGASGNTFWLYRIAQGAPDATFATLAGGTWTLVSSALGAKPLPDSNAVVAGQGFFFLGR